MLERKFQIQFRKWAKENIKTSAAFELKVCKTALPFNAVPDHQIQGLWNAKHGRILMKLVDCGYQNPFDMFQLVEVPAYVVVRFSSGNFYLIDIDSFIELKNTIGNSKSSQFTRKSLTEELCKHNAFVI